MSVDSEGSIKDVYEAMLRQIKKNRTPEKLAEVTCDNLRFAIELENCQIRAEIYQREREVKYRG